MNTWLATLLQQILKQISPELRKVVVDMVKVMEEKAATTPNPWDDILVGIIKFILVIP